MIPSTTIPAPHLRRGHLLAVSVPTTRLEQLPTHLSAGGGVLDTHHRAHPERFGIDPANVERTFLLTVERLDDNDTTVTVTAGLPTFAYDGTPQYSSYQFVLLATAQVEVLTHTL